MQMIEQSFEHENHNLAAVWLNNLRQERAIAVIRSPSLTLGSHMAAAIAAGGIHHIEITWNSDRPAHLIAHLRETLPQCNIGAGTLLTEANVKEAIAAGAQFLFTPHTQPELIGCAVQAGCPMVAGTLTPTEIVTAWQAGATAAKVFPIQAVGGADYIRSLQGPLGQIPLIPTGGVTLDNAAEFLSAGAIAVGLSGQLFPKRAIEAKDWDVITQAAQVLMQRLNGEKRV
ncbi:bifunctional 4-hydroxy-2-oxoglutarate aldolase/2-dehydro-3-deoxy-phosphogluconate aldolase [Vacuolonema iberomarrocanum]|uniref:bifunctional 4-hydroxy-2-oxoglutarate aldolase/2-dehydro-3-deoxy-phosphogluconate aldolase n=1 Tax=Vacuolonema iberomarrocanum TaxID=3454632 RepID=UPI003F6DF2AC